MVVVNTGKKMPEIFNSSSQSQRLTGGPTANHADRCHEPEMEVEDDEEGEEVALQPECDQQTATTSAVPRRLSSLPQRGLPSLNGATFRGLSSGTQRHLRITLYVNGDRHFPGRPYVINLDRIKTVDLLCAELTRLLVSVKSLPSGVRYILDIDTGAAVQWVGELSVGGHYAVSSTVRLVRTLHYRSLNLLQRHLAAVAAAAASSASNTSNSSAVVDCSSSSLYESSKNGAKDSLLTRSTGAVSGGGGTSGHHHQHQYHQSHHHHHHKSAVFGLHHLSNSAHLPSSSSSSGGRNCSPSSLALKPNAASSSNGSSSLTLSASLSLHSNCGYLGGTLGRSTQAIRPKIVALLRGSCRAAPHLRPSRRPIRLLLNYRIAQTFEQVINEISAAVVASQCNQQVQQQHHQLNVVGAVHRVYGLATNKKITSLDDFLVDNEHVYLVYGRTERCTLLDFMLDECEQREISAIIGSKSITNYQLPGELVKQQLYSGKHSQNNSENRAKNGQTTASEGRAIRFHLTPKQSKKQCQAETAEEGSAAFVTSTSATKKHPQQLKQTKKPPQNLSKNLSSRDGNNNDKDVKAFSLPRNFLVHPKSARSYRSQKGSKRSDQRARTAGTREPFSPAKSNKLDFEQGHCTSATEEATLKSLLDTEVSSSSSCFSSIYSLKEDGSESLGAGSRLGLPYDSHHFLKNSTSENVLGEAFYRHHLLPLYPANISNSLVYDSSHHHQKEQLKHHHHPHYLHQHSSSSSPNSPHFSAVASDQQSDTTSSEDHNRGSNLVTSFSGSSSTTTTTTPGAASSVSCSEDFSNFAAAAETEDYSSEMYSHLRQKQQQQQQQQSRHHTAALRSEESSSSSDSSTPSFSSLSCTVRVPGQGPTSSVSGHRSNKTSSSKNGGGSFSSTSTNSTPKHRPNYSTSTTQKGTPQHHHHHQRYSEFDLDDDEPPELLEGNDDDDEEEDEEDEVEEEENDAENLAYEDEPPLPPAKRHLPLVPKREVARLYDIGEAIGDGKFGVVYTCLQRGSGRVYALKVVDKSAMMEMMAKSSQQENQPRSLATSSSSSSSANTEAAILKRISHPNIVKIYDHFEYVDQSYLVLELFKGGDLFDAISSAGRYGEAESLEMFRDLMEALAYLHRHHIIHRDIKLENLMVAFVPLTAAQPLLPPKSRTGAVNSQNARLSAGENNRRISSGIPGIGGGSSSSSIPTRRYRQAIKLADFGLATEILPNELLFTVCGTPTYVAPEILLEIGYSYPVDIWAAGVIAFILLCGYPPFANEENNQDLLFDQILAGRFDFDDRHWAEVSDQAKALISDMLNTEQSARLTAEQVLKHSWLTKLS